MLLRDMALHLLLEFNLRLYGWCAMTTKLLIDRELLERLACEVMPTTHQELLDASDDFGAAIKELRAILAATRQPVGPGFHDGAKFASNVMRSYSPQPSAVPDGWKLVPIEPTEEMLESDFISCHCGHDFSPALFDHVWHKMIAAAPSAPATVQGDWWIPVSERLPQIKQVLSEKCTLEGREIPTLYRSGMVLTFDGSRVSAGIIEWFHSKSPLNNVTHWMPLPAAPAIAAARQEGVKV